MLHQRVAQARVLDALDRLADEGLDQQRLGLLRRDAARHQVEQQILVELARGRAVAALHVVGENFELRLVVGLGVSDSSSACVAILASVFCASARTMILPWKTPRLSPSSTVLNTSRLWQPPTA